MASTLYFGVVAPAPAQTFSSISRLAVQSQAQPARLGVLRLRAVPGQEGYVAYDGDQSVFPAEACDELGGEYCEADGVGAEVKPKAEVKPDAARSQPQVRGREYLEYRRLSKTVFPGEACDELGGEFCEPDYQAGVFQERK